MVAIASTPQATARFISFFVLQVQVPTLVVCGSEDEITPAAGMRAMAQRIRGAEYVEVPEAGHLAPLERPEFVNRALEDFLLRASFR